MFISVAQNIFTNRLIRYWADINVSSNVQEILSVGADDLRAHFSNYELIEVLNAYMVGLRAAWILGIACAGAAFVASFGSKYRNIMAPRVPALDSEQSSESQTNDGEDKKI